MPAWTNRRSGLAGLSLIIFCLLGIPALFAFNMAGVIDQYLEILFIVLLLFLFVLGIFMCLWACFQNNKKPAEETKWSFNIKIPADRAGFLVLIPIAGFCILLLSATGSALIRYSESNHFCTNVCHTVMGPQAIFQKNSPHARVSCVQCHIRSGSAPYIQAKMAGISRVISLLTGSYKKPLPDIDHGLHPARESCENCHWTDKFTGDKLYTYTHFDENSEFNAPLYTSLILRVGGKLNISASRGIHSHTDERIIIQYRETRESEEIVQVEINNTLTGEKEIFRKEGFEKTADSDLKKIQTMSCVDCHNRIAHPQHTAENGVDEALLSGELNIQLPWIKREAVQLLKQNYPADESIEITKNNMQVSLMQFYQSRYPAKAESLKNSIEQAALTLSKIYHNNIFPEMNITWETYQSNASHWSNPGCFRCHAGDFYSTEPSSQKSIGSDCNLCHKLLAHEEPTPGISDD